MLMTINFKFIFNVFLIFTFLNISFPLELWQKDIPPSHYLGELAKIQNKNLNRGYKTTNILSLIAIALGASAVKQGTPEGLMGGVVLIVGGIGVSIGSYISKKINNISSLAQIELNKLDYLETNSQIEYTAYNSLVLLSKNSVEALSKQKTEAKVKRLENQKNKENNQINNGDYLKFLFKKIVSNKILSRSINDFEDYKTIEEIVLYNYLNQIDIK